MVGIQFLVLHILSFASQVITFTSVSRPELALLFLPTTTTFTTSTTMMLWMSTTSIASTTFTTSRLPSTRNRLVDIRRFTTPAATKAALSSQNRSAFVYSHHHKNHKSFHHRKHHPSTSCCWLATIRGGGSGTGGAKSLGALSMFLSTSTNRSSANAPFQQDHAISSATKKNRKQHRVYLAVGSNLGDRYHNIFKGLSLLCDPNYQPPTAGGDNDDSDDIDITVKQPPATRQPAPGESPSSRSSYGPSTRWVGSSFLYHTAPMYVTDQPAFLNGVVEIETDLNPHELLRRLKSIERDMGRDLSPTNAPPRNGPRPLDLDIVLWYSRRTTNDGNVTDGNNDEDDYDSDIDDAKSSLRHVDEVPLIMDTPDLIIPHPRLQEREFVLVPLVDMATRRSSTSDTRRSNLIHPTLSNETSVVTIADLLDDLISKDDAPATTPNNEDGTSSVPPASRLIPLPRGRHILFSPHQTETLIMGVLNVTPDSFSDGGLYNASVDDAVQHALQMIRDGATIIDIGGESTRPGASPMSKLAQIERTVPVIAAIRRLDSNVILSIDTRSAAVARAAVIAGADIVNDVSGGTFDADMLSTVAELHVPIVLMHMRGTPESMQYLTQYGGDGGGVVEAVVNGLLERSHAAEEAGIPRWMQILDPGIGFAKDLDGNLSLLKNLSTTMRTQLGDFPILLGTSRKGFLGKLLGETVAEERDFGTIGSCVATLCLGRGTNDGTMKGRATRGLGCNILRVHNVKAVKQATVVMDAIVNAR